MAALPNSVSKGQRFERAGSDGDGSVGLVGSACLRCRWYVCVPISGAPDVRGLGGFSAQGLRRVWLGVAGVVPFAVPVVDGEGDGGKFGVAVLDALGVLLGVVFVLDREAGRGGRGGDQFDDGAQAGEEPTASVHRDKAEHAVLDHVPLRGSWRLVADRDGQSVVGGESGDADFPAAWPAAVGAAGGSGDQQSCRVWEPSATRWFHQARIDVTGTSAVSATSPTEPQPSLLATS